YRTLEFFHSLKKDMRESSIKNKFLKVTNFDRTRQMTSLSLNMSNMRPSTPSVPHINDIDWSEFCSSFIGGFSMVKFPQFHKLVESGVIQSLRGMIWQMCS